MDNNTTHVTMMQRLSSITKASESKVKLNIGGTVFTTSIETLCSKNNSTKDNLFSVMFNGNFNMTPDENDEYFIDRDAKYFPIVLKHLRGYDVSETIQSLDDLERKQLAEDVDFYQISSMFHFFPSHISEIHEDIFEESTRRVTKVAVPLKNGSVKIIDMENGQVLQTIARSHMYDKHILSCGNKIVTADNRGTMYVWDCKTGQTLHTLVNEAFKDVGVTLLFKISEDLVACAKAKFVNKHNMGQIHIWDINEGKCLFILEHIGAVSRIMNLSKPSMFLVVSAKSMSVWDVTREHHTMKFRVVLQRGINKKSITEVADQKIAFFEDKNVKIWNLATYQSIQNITTDHMVSNGSDIWTFSRNRIALVNDHEVTVIDISSGKTLINIKYNYCAVQLSNQSFVTYNADQQLIEIWDTYTSSRTKALLSQHTGGICSIVKLCENRIATSGGNSVNIWDLNSGICVHTFNYSGSLLKLSDQHIANVKYYNHSLNVNVWSIDTGSCICNILENDYDYNREITPL
jgi:WD40 repeat protein